MSDFIFYPITKDLFNKLHLKSTALLSEYYKEYYKAQIEDLSFVCESDNKVFGYVLCYKLEQKLCLPNDGLKINFLENNLLKIEEIYKKILEHLVHIAKQTECTEIIIKDHLVTGQLSPIGEILFNNKFCAKLTFEMLIDYKNFSEKNYRSKIRKAYKSLINWGKNNLDIKIINNQNQCLEDFLSFKNFHIKISGRQTRSDDSWSMQYDMLCQGFGELILGFYQGKLIAGSLFADSGDTSFYFSGVYERELFEYGVSHYLLYYGICRSLARSNIRQFSLGYFDTNFQDPKLYNIQFFKKGFCERLEPTILWSKLFCPDP